LNEVRKVVNNIIAADGKPDKICIELARDVKLTPNQLSQVNKTNADNEKARKKAAEALTECQISADNRTIDKYLLWKECQETCPYTGDKIGFDALFRQNKFQVEHIFPRRSLDNRMQNKTLARTDMNSKKNDRSPYDAFGHTDQWPEMVERAKKLLPENKAKRFCSTLGPPEDMSERQLQDTAYAARAAKEFLTVALSASSRKS
jgi:CRISPR-associated endonuclease Csn1